MKILRQVLSIAFCAISAFAQVRESRHLDIGQTAFRLRAGERVSLNMPRETKEFLLAAASMRVDGARGIAIGPNIRKTEVLLATSLTMKPGKYDFTFSASSSAQEERRSAITVIVDALSVVPVTSAVPPVVLLNGWQFSVFPPSACPISSSSADTFGSLAQQLTSANNVPQVYFFDNCVEQTMNGAAIEQLGVTLGQFLGMIQYTSGGMVPQVDLVGHSMGGLIVRSYLSGLQINGSLSSPATVPVRKFVEIATPNFGSFLAGNFSDFIGSGTQSAEMVPGSNFLWNLATWNQRGDDLRGVDALAIIGNAGSWTSSVLSFSTQSNASDGVVSLTSASLGFARDSSRTRIVPYCHIDSASSAGGVIDCSGRGIANVDQAPETGKIVLAFLAGSTSVWTSSTLSSTPAQNTWLAQDGGILFGWVDAAGQQVTDLSQASFGSESLKSGRASGTIFYDEFAKGSGAFQATSKSLGSTNCPSVTEPAGYYTAWRCKSASSLTSVTPLLTGASIVQSGSNITINGTGFGQQCATCQVTASNTVLKVSSWSDQAIVAFLLPYPITQSVSLSVQTSTGSDSITFLVSPPIVITSISNAGSSFAGPIAPGELVAIKGAGLGPATGVSFSINPATGMVDTSLAGTKVFFGSYAAPILYSSTGQVNALVPYEISGQTQVVVQVQYQGLSAQATVTSNGADPGLFTFDSTGTGPALAVNQDGSLNGSSHPAAGGSYVILYLTGGGPTIPAGVTGSISGTDLKRLVQNVTATVGGQPSTVLFAGSAPYFIDGLVQLNVTIPGGVHGTVPVIVTVGGTTTAATATLAIL